MDVLGRFVLGGWGLVQTSSSRTISRVFNVSFGALPLSFSRCLCFVSPKIAAISFVPVPSSFLFESRNRKSFSYVPKKLTRVQPKKSTKKTTLQVVYMNAKKEETQRTLLSKSLVMQIGFTGNTCFTFHEISLDCTLIEVVNGYDLAPVPISCHAQPNTAGDQVTLEFQLDQAQTIVKINVNAIHTQSGKPLSSLKTETEEIYIAGSGSSLKKRSFEELQCSRIPPPKIQKLTESQNALTLFCSSDLVSFEELFNFDFTTKVDIPSSPINSLPILPDDTDDLISMLGLEC